MLAERKKRKEDDDTVTAEDEKVGKDTKEEKEDDKDEEDYMDQEMRELDERSRMRISILFREFKNELESYVPPNNEKPGKFF